MANDGTVDQQQLQETLNEAYRIAGEWVGRILALSEVTKDGQLGELAIYQTIEAAINGGRLGNAGNVRNSLGLSAAATRGIVGGSGQLMAKGAYGLGDVSVRLYSSDNLADLPFEDKFICWYGDKPASLPADASDYGAGVVFCNTSGNYQYKFYIIHDSNDNVWTASNRGTATSIIWRTARTSKNTTIDSNGFLKNASPIFRLANDEVDAAGEGFNGAGAGTANDEAAGVTASHVDIGVYTVTGSLGLATDGWTIEIPQDVNGNRLCFVETETADNGTITVRTFGRRFDYEIAMIVAGDPIDIPDGRWIDLRLRMPTLLI